MLKRLTIENFESIKDKETQHLKIYDAGVEKGGNSYVFIFKIKGNDTTECGEVIINRHPSPDYELQPAYYLEIRWKTRNNPIYSENVYWNVFKQKAELFQQLDKIIMERVN